MLNHKGFSKQFISSDALQSTRIALHFEVSVKSGLASPDPDPRPCLTLNVPLQVPCPCVERVFQVSALTPEIVFDEITDFAAGMFHLLGAWRRVVVTGSIDGVLEHVELARMRRVAVQEGIDMRA